MNMELAKEIVISAIHTALEGKAEVTEDMQLIGGESLLDLSSPQFLYHKFFVSLIRFQEQAVAYQARGVA